MNPVPEIDTIVSLPFEENTYIVRQTGRRDAIVIDPGLDPGAIIACLERHELGVAAILNTHGHADHIAGNGAIKGRYPHAPLIIGAGDAAMLADADLNLSAPFGMPVVSPPADQWVRDGDVLDFAGIRLVVREIPGHSPGHVVFIAGRPDAERAEIIVFGGDVLFHGSVGRCDFPGGSMELLAAGIREKLYTLPDDAVIYPGHGPATTVGREKRSNPFVRG